RQSCKWQPAPSEYWDNWRKECLLADRIIVNSAWTRESLLADGVDGEKVAVVPLAFDARPGAVPIDRRSPTEISQARPLRVLFLGQVNLRKGVGPILEAVRLLRKEPIEFWFVGPIQMAVSTEFQYNPRIRWVGSVPRSDVAQYYREADVLLFPT